MKLRVFQSDKGDCVLVESSTGFRLLADGGMRSSYKAHVAESMGEIREENGKLDLVCISHIDRDHIWGILQMLDDEVAWRVHEFQQANGNPGHKKPKAPRPPKIDKIWHNGFSQMVDDNKGKLKNMLSQSAEILSASAAPEMLDLSAHHAELAASVGDAVQLSHRIGDRQLGIPLNPEANGKLIMVGKKTPLLKSKGFHVRVLGPLEEDVEKLRTEWNKWLERNENALEDMRRRAFEDERQMASKSDVDRLLLPLLAQAEQLGDRSKVTAPNLASIMLLVEENGATVLLTGDGHAEDILKGLDHHGKLDAKGRAHVNVLKVQHHGSEHNIDADFCGRVTADHYVFCGNGAHENPDLDVVETLVAARQAEKGKRAYKLWFNSSSSVTEGDTSHMRKLERLVATLQNASGGRMQSQFLKESFFDLDAATKLAKAAGAS
ncbi:MAG: hypothetical protein FJW20_10525 [Acidimicrobiia bacterium]|nr:hypothetical protein [Acidimicrobiia bacterium]